MKERITVTISPGTLEMIDRIMKTDRFRSVSHLVEDAIKLFAEKSNDKNKK